MLSAVHTLNWILPVLYLGSFIVYTYDFAKGQKTFHNSKRIFLFVTLLLHTFYLLSRTIEFNHPPITNKFEIFTILAFAISFSYFLLELLTDIRGTGSFIIFFSLVFQLISSIYIKDLLEVQEVLRSRLLGLHVTSALLGYSGITISAVYGLLFILLYKEIKLSKFGIIFKRLPSLETLEKLSFYSAAMGFVLLTFTIIIGIIWLPLAFDEFSYSDPKLISTGIIWIVYGIGILTKLLGNWYGKKVIIFSLLGFTLMLLSLLLSNLLANTFHTFS